MTRRRRRHGCSRQDRGAAAVEFALVTPLLLIMLFGIVDYGIWFSDSISARQAVRDGARNGAVESFGACPATVTGNDADLHKLACTIEARMDQISGATYVRVLIRQDPLPTSTTDVTWKPGVTLRVCAITQHTALLPFVPFPAGGIAKTRVDIPIEQAAGAAAGTRISYTAEAPPAGTDWASWCP